VVRFRTLVRTRTFLDRSEVRGGPKPGRTVQNRVRTPNRKATMRSAGVRTPCEHFEHWPHCSHFLICKSPSRQRWPRHNRLGRCELPELVTLVFVHEGSTCTQVDSTPRPPLSNSGIYPPNNDVLDATTPSPSESLGDFFIFAHTVSVFGA